MTPMALVNILLVGAEILIWKETGWSAGLMFPMYIVVNGALAAGLIVAWVRVLGPRFSRFPTRPRFYATIDVPSLPAPARAPAPPRV
jgi:hypothetical protein